MYKTAYEQKEVNTLNRVFVQFSIKEETFIIKKCTHIRPHQASYSLIAAPKQARNAERQFRYF
jgi:hypothetical protein